MSKATKNNGKVEGNGIAELEPVTVGDTYGNTLVLDPDGTVVESNRLTAGQQAIVDAELAAKAPKNIPGEVAERVITEGMADAKSVADIKAPVNIETLASKVEPKLNGAVETAGSPEVATATMAAALVEAKEPAAKLSAMEVYQLDYSGLVADAESQNHTENEMYSSFKVFSDVNGFQKGSKEERDYRKSLWNYYRGAFKAAYPMNVTFCGRTLQVTKIGNEKPILNKVTGVVEKIRRTLTTEEYQSKREAIEYHARQLRRAERS